MNAKIQKPNLIIILFSLVYEALLIISITFLSLIIAGILVYLLKNYSLKIKTLITSTIILSSWYLYFITNWQKGQTLAMKTWNIYLKDNNNNYPSKKKLFLRFIWIIIFIIFIPLIIYFICKTYNDINSKTSLILAITWWIIPWGWAICNHQRKFIYDQLSGTKLVTIKKIK